MQIMTQKPSEYIENIIFAKLLRNPNVLKQNLQLNTFLINLIIKIIKITFKTIHLM